MYYGGFTWTEAYNVPINYRRWFINEIVQEMKRSGGNDQESDPTPMGGPRNISDPNAPVTQSRARSLNTPDARAWRGENRQHVPSRLIRF